MKGGEGWREGEGGVKGGEGGREGGAGGGEREGGREEEKEMKGETHFIRIYL